MDKFVVISREGKRMNNQSIKQRTVLTLEDMTNLIIIYDAVRQLSRNFFGYYEIFEEDEGIMGALGNVWKVIVNGTSIKIKQLGEDESFDKILDILNAETSPPRERAMKLLE